MAGGQVEERATAARSAATEEPQPSTAALAPLFSLAGQGAGGTGGPGGVGGGLAGGLGRGGLRLLAGGTGLVGGVLARGLARAGAGVGVLGRRRAEADTLVAAIVAEGGAALALPADVLARAQLEIARDSIIEQWGRLDI